VESRLNEYGDWKSQISGEPLRVKISSCTPGFVPVTEIVLVTGVDPLMVASAAGAVMHNVTWYALPAGPLVAQVAAALAAGMVDAAPATEARQAAASIAAARTRTRRARAGTFLFIVWTPS
jgi:hypothetical protein